MALGQLKECIPCVLGYSNLRPQTEPGFRPRGPGSKEPATGEGEDVALTGGKHCTEVCSRLYL